MSSFNVQPVEVASGAAPSFSIPASENPGTGMLHSDGASGPFDCGGYHSKDPNAVQFFISNSFRGTLTYQDRADGHQIVQVVESAGQGRRDR